jgi:hypothetical protein
MESIISHSIELGNSSSEDLSGKESDPGAARLGNFINYYQFNPPSERLSLLFPDKLYNRLDLHKSEDSIVCLDVGCNSGVSKRF